MTRPRGNRLARVRRAALALAERHPDAFHDDPRDFLERTSRAERMRVWALDERIARAFLDTSLADAPSGTVALARHAASRAKDAFVTQRAVSMELRKGFHDRVFWVSTGLRLVRGYTNCEGQNHLLARLLIARGVSAHLVETWRTGRADATHSLVEIDLGSRSLFADAWTEFPLFTLAEDGALWDVPTYASLVARGLGENDGLHARECYVHRRRERMRVPLDALVRRELVREDPLRERIRGGGAQPGWALHLRARIETLFGELDEARRHYDRLLAMTGVCSPLAEVARAHRERLR